MSPIVVCKKTYDFTAYPLILNVCETCFFKLSKSSIPEFCLYNHEIQFSSSCLAAKYQPTAESGGGTRFSTFCRFGMVLARVLVASGLFPTHIKNR
jgi:hypothetical protein